MPTNRRHSLLRRRKSEARTHLSERGAGRPAPSLGPWRPRRPRNNRGRLAPESGRMSHSRRALTSRRFDRGRVVESVLGVRLAARPRWKRAPGGRVQISAPRYEKSRVCGAFLYSLAHRTSVAIAQSLPQPPRGVCSSRCGGEPRCGTWSRSTSEFSPPEGRVPGRRGTEPRSGSTTQQAYGHD
jgi:hypothetical protein